MASPTAEQQKLIASIAEWVQRFSGGSAADGDAGGDADQAIAAAIREEFTALFAADTPDSTDTPDRAPNLFLSLNKLAEHSELLRLANENANCRHCLTHVIKFFARDSKAREAFANAGVPNIHDALVTHIDVYAFADTIEQAKSAAATNPQEAISPWRTELDANCCEVLGALEAIRISGPLGSPDAYNTCVTALKPALEEFSDPIDAEVLCRACLVTAPPLSELMQMAGCATIADINRPEDNRNDATDKFVRDQFARFLADRPSIFHALEIILLHSENPPAHEWLPEDSELDSHLRCLMYSMLPPDLMTGADVRFPQSDDVELKYPEICGDLHDRIYLRELSAEAKQAPEITSVFVAGALAAAAGGTGHAVLASAADILSREYAATAQEDAELNADKLHYHLRHQHLLDPALDTALDIATAVANDTGMLELDLDAVPNDILAQINTLTKIGNAIRYLQLSAVAEAGRRCAGGPSLSVPNHIADLFVAGSDSITLIDASGTQSTEAQFSTHALTVEARQRLVEAEFANLSRLPPDRLNLFVAANGVFADPALEQTFAELAASEGSDDLAASEGSDDFAAGLYELERFFARNGDLLSQKGCALLAKKLDELFDDREHRLGYVLEKHELTAMSKAETYNYFAENLGTLSQMCQDAEIIITKIPAPSDDVAACIQSIADFKCCLTGENQQILSRMLYAYPNLNQHIDDIINEPQLVAEAE